MEVKSYQVRYIPDESGGRWIQIVVTPPRGRTIEQKLFGPSGFVQDKVKKLPKDLPTTEQYLVSEIRDLCIAELEQLERIMRPYSAQEERYKRALEKDLKVVNRVYVRPFMA